MIKAIYSVIDGVCQVTDEVTGVKIKIPKPSKGALKSSCLTNGITGASLVVFGLLTPYKWTIILGGLGVASSLAMREEIKHL